MENLFLFNIKNKEFNSYTATCNQSPVCVNPENTKKAKTEIFAYRNKIEADIFENKETIKNLTRENDYKELLIKRLIIFETFLSDCVLENINNKEELNKVINKIFNKYRYLLYRLQRGDCFKLKNGTILTWENISVHVLNEIEKLGLHTFNVI